MDGWINGWIGFDHIWSIKQTFCVLNSFYFLQLFTCINVIIDIGGWTSASCIQCVDICLSCGISHSWRTLDTYRRQDWLTLLLFPGSCPMVRTQRMWRGSRLFTSKQKNIHCLLCLAFLTAFFALQPEVFRLLVRDICRYSIWFQLSFITTSTVPLVDKMTQRHQERSVRNINAGP